MSTEIKDIKESITQAIEEHLPKAVGQVLQQRLEAGSRAEIDLKLSKGVIASHEATIKTTMAELAEAKAQLKLHAELDVRTRTVEARERDMEVTLLKTQLVAAEASKTFARDVALGLVRNIEFRKEVFSGGNENVITQSSGGYTNVQSMPFSNSSNEKNTVV